MWNKWYFQRFCWIVLIFKFNFFFCLKSQHPLWILSKDENWTLWKVQGWMNIVWFLSLGMSFKISLKFQGCKMDFFLDKIKIILKLMFLQTYHSIWKKIIKTHYWKGSIYSTPSVPNYRVPTFEGKLNLIVFD